MEDAGGKQQHLSKEKESEAIPLLLKGLIKTSRLTRQHQALLLTTLIGGKEVHWVSEVKAAGSDYHQLTHGKGGHGLGPPAPFLWAAFCHSVVENYQGATLTKETQDQLKKPPTAELTPLWLFYRDFLLTPVAGGGTAPELQRHLESRIQQFKLEELRDDQVRIMLRIVDEDLYKATVAPLHRSTFTLKLGPAPPDYLERQAQKLLGGNPRRGGRGK